MGGGPTSCNEEETELTDPHTHSPAEGGALILAEAAAELDRAADPHSFLRALERNRRVWQAIKHLADRHHWRAPSRRQASYALATVRKMGKGVSDDHLHALIDINRHVSAELAGGDLDSVRRRWEGRDLEQWLESYCG